MFVPHSIIQEDNFNFYSRGRDLWANSFEFKDQIEDKFRHQLEKSDLL